MGMNMTKNWDDTDPIETKEWLDALSSVIKHEGSERANYLLQRLMHKASEHNLQADFASAITTPYTNTIPVELQPSYPGDLHLEQKIEAINRWNAVALVLRAKKTAGGVGGHLSSYASIATLYEVGLNHFFKGSTAETPGDLV